MCGFFVRDKFDRFYEKISQDNRSTDKALIFDEYFVYEDLNSPYIVDVYSYNNDDNSYIMEYMDFTLDKFIRLNNDKISSGVRKSIILQLLKA